MGSVDLTYIQFMNILYTALYVLNAQGNVARRSLKASYRAVWYAKQDQIEISFLSLPHLWTAAQGKSQRHWKRELHTIIILQYV